MKKFYLVLLISTAMAVSSCKKDNVAKPAGDRLKTLMPAPDSTGAGGSGGEDRPKPTG